MSRLVAWRRLAQLGPFHWRNVAPGRAARVALGVVVPLGLGWASGHVDYGAYAALGALPAGVASFQGETRSRVAVVVAASVGMAVSTFVGATTAALAPWLLVPVVGIWGYFTGLGVALGPRFGVAVLQWSSALLFAVGLRSVPAGPLCAPAWCWPVDYCRRRLLPPPGPFGLEHTSKRRWPPRTGPWRPMPPIWQQADPIRLRRPPFQPTLSWTTPTRCCHSR